MKYCYTVSKVIGEISYVCYWYSKRCLHEFAYRLNRSYSTWLLISFGVYACTDVALYCSICIWDDGLGINSCKIKLFTYIF